MALEELHKAIDSEREKFTKWTPVTIVLGMLVMLMWTFILYADLRELWTGSRYFRPDILGLKMANIVLWIPTIYQSLKQYKFALKLAERLKESTISGALDLLDFYEEGYRRVWTGIFLILSVLLAAFLYWLIGWSLSWWEWDDFQFAIHVTFLVMILGFCVAYFPFTEKWKKRFKARKNVEKLMEEYLQQEGRQGVRLEDA